VMCGLRCCDYSVCFATWNERLKEGNARHKTYIDFFPLWYVTNQSRQSEKTYQAEEFYHTQDLECPSGMNELEAVNIVTEVLWRNQNQSLVTTGYSKSQQKPRYTSCFLQQLEHKVLYVLHLMRIFWLLRTLIACTKLVLFQDSQSEGTWLQ